MSLLERWRVLRLLVAAAKHISAHQPDPPLSASEERRVAAIEAVLECWLKNEIRDASTLLAKLGEACGLEPALIRRTIRIFA